MRNVAVILAGGVGTRMGGTMPKQFFKVSGKTVLEHTISVFRISKQPKITRNIQA